MSLTATLPNQPGLFQPRLPAFPGKPAFGSPTNSIRSTRKAARWGAAVHRAYVYMSDRVHDPAARAALESYYQQTLESGPDFLKVRATADFSRPEAIPFDKAMAAEIMKQARQIEQGSYAARGKGKHTGLFSRTAMQLLEWFCYVFWPCARYGMFPSITHIMKGARMSRQSVVTAMKTLKLFGFLDVQPRRKVVETPLGTKVVQDTNCYVLRLAKGLGALALSVFGRKKQPSESSKLPAKEIHISKKEETQIDPDLMAALDRYGAAIRRKEEHGAR
jgi:hypothetical protein